MCNVNFPAYFPLSCLSCFKSMQCSKKNLCSQTFRAECENHLQFSRSREYVHCCVKLLHVQVEILRNHISIDLFFT